MQTLSFRCKPCHSVASIVIHLNTVIHLSTVIHPSLVILSAAKDLLLFCALALAFLSAIPLANLLF